MKKTTDKLGYLMFVCCYIFIVFNYGKYNLYESLYLVSGDSFDGKVLESSGINGKVIYLFAYNDHQTPKTINSNPTKTYLKVNEVKKIRVIPYFNIALLYSFSFIPYFVTSVFFLFGFLFTIHSFLKIFNISISKNT